MRKTEASGDDADTVLAWPEGVARITGLSTVTLQKKRAAGDAPRLYAISERQLVTTKADLLAWVRAKEVPPTYKCRPATVPQGGRNPGMREAA